MNLLPLETWRAIYGIHPWHFHGLSSSQYAPINSQCPTVTYEHAWQDANAVGRAEIRQAIATAETRLREYLGYSVAPHYTSDTLAFASNVQLREGYVQAIGAEVLTLVGEVALTFSDADSDGLMDTFTATVATSETDPEHLAVYFVAAERLDGEGVSDRWKIAPATITINGGSATIRGRRWLMVRPILYEGLRSTALDPATAANFATSIAVYSRHTSDPQATLSWNSGPYPACCVTGDASADPAAVATATARVGLLDARYGIVAPAQALYDPGTGLWAAVPWSTCRWPDKVTVNSYAGVPLVNGQMDSAWQLIVARLAAAELGKPICACETANRELHTWQTDLARTGGNNDEQFGAISAADLSNPFGTRRGHVYAWHRVSKLLDLRGFLPG